MHHIFEIVLLVLVSLTTAVNIKGIEKLQSKGNLLILSFYE